MLRSLKKILLRVLGTAIALIVLFYLVLAGHGVDIGARGTTLRGHRHCFSKWRQCLPSIQRKRSTPHP